MLELDGQAFDIRAQEQGWSSRVSLSSHPRHVVLQSPPFAEDPHICVQDPIDVMRTKRLPKALLVIV
jgi:hypothetical protein